ncbi:MAG TPA: hypothetical protein VFY96_04745, partial [Candidatus Binatia bacterium]|nr:hypothetical protein [Candidatus Binatia bacterium]
MKNCVRLFTRRRWGARVWHRDGGRKHREDKTRDRWVREVVADKGYHSNELLKDLRVLGIRTYIS